MIAPTLRAAFGLALFFLAFGAYLVLTLTGGLLALASDVFTHGADWLESWADDLMGGEW